MVPIGISYPKSELKLRVTAICFQPFTLLCRQNSHTWGPDGVALTEDDIVNGCVMGPHGSSA